MHSPKTISAKKIVFSLSYFIKIYLSIYGTTFVIPKSIHLPSRMLCLKSVLQQQTVVSNEFMLFSAQGAQTFVHRDTEPQRPDCHCGSQFKVRSRDRHIAQTHRLPVPERRDATRLYLRDWAAQQYKTREREREKT